MGVAARSVLGSHNHSHNLCGNALEVNGRGWIEKCPFRSILCGCSEISGRVWNYRRRTLSPPASNRHVINRFQSQAISVSNPRFLNRCDRVGARWRGPIKCGRLHVTESDRCERTNRSHATRFAHIVSASVVADCAQFRFLGFRRSLAAILEGGAPAIPSRRRGWRA